MSGSALASAASRSSFDRMWPPVLRSSDLRPIAVGMERRNGRRAERRRRRWQSRSLAARAVAGERVDADGILGPAARNARVDDVDDAADRRGAEQQSGRAAQHLDPLGGERVDRDGMVGAGRRQVELPMPSVSTRTRSPERPRSTGAEAAGPKLVALTPGWRARVSPMLGRTSRVRSAASSTEMPPSTSCGSRRTPVTMISPSSSPCRDALPPRCPSRGSRSSGKRSVCRVDRCVSGESGDGEYRQSRPRGPGAK